MTEKENNFTLLLINILNFISDNISRKVIQKLKISFLKIYYINYFTTALYINNVHKS